MVISIDFDGTIVENAYPGIGRLKPNAVAVINRLKEEGHQIIINTCRSGIFEGNAYSFLNAVGIEYDYINSNLPDRIEYYKADTRKISADLYIDDKDLFELPEDWEDIYKLIKKYEKRTSPKV